MGSASVGRCVRASYACVWACAWGVVWMWLDRGEQGVGGTRTRRHTRSAHPRVHSHTPGYNRAPDLGRRRFGIMPVLRTWVCVAAIGDQGAQRRGRRRIAVRAGVTLRARIDFGVWVCQHEHGGFGPPGFQAQFLSGRQRGAVPIACRHVHACSHT